MKMENKNIMILMIIIMIAGFIGTITYVDSQVEASNIEISKLYANDELIAQKTLGNEQAIIQVGMATGVIVQEPVQGEQTNGEQSTE